MNVGARHRQMMILGMLLESPMYGHQIKETIDKHLEVVSDLKRANLYYLLDQLSARGYLEVRLEPLEADSGPVAKPVERYMYYITATGREYFLSLLRDVLGSFETVHPPIDMALFFLPHLPREEAFELLAERRRILVAQYQALQDKIATTNLSVWHEITNDHMLSLYQLEIGWLDRVRAKLEQVRSLRLA